jgi:malate dehydrogenase (oxaloacetate-decarboxylating)
VVATDRSDFPKQVNNSLGFPGECWTSEPGPSPTGWPSPSPTSWPVAQPSEGGKDDYILPTVDDREVVPKVAVATARTAVAEGVTDLDIPEDDLAASVRRIVEAARATTALLMESRPIPPPPPEAGSGAGP